jgi:CheY-like chemotaxis protein
VDVRGIANASAPRAAGVSVEDRAALLAHADHSMAGRYASDDVGRLIGQANLVLNRQEDGHLVTVANGGQAGIDAFRAAHERGERFAAGITDLGMPHVDGRKVAESVKVASPRAPVIMLTGWGAALDDEWRRAASRRPHPRQAAEIA